MKKIRYICAFFTLYIICGICYYDWNMDVRREYGNVILPMIFYIVCSLVLGTLLFLFLQECAKNKKYMSKTLFITIIGLFILSFMPYAFYIPNLPIFVSRILIHFVKIINFSPIAGFSLAMCIMMYIANARKHKVKKAKLFSDRMM